MVGLMGVVGVVVGSAVSGFVGMAYTWGTACGGLSVFPAIATGAMVGTPGATGVALAAGVAGCAYQTHCDHGLDWNSFKACWMGGSRVWAYACLAAIPVMMGFGVVDMLS